MTRIARMKSSAECFLTSQEIREHPCNQWLMVSEFRILYQLPNGIDS